jgi:dihydrodipicolinate synthase/N-acetylneuraminate lyase
MSPFDASGAIDTDALESQVDFLIDGGVHGLVALGTMGEYRALDEHERDVVIRTIVAVAAGRVPVTVGVSSDAPATGARRAERARSLGATAVMSMPPVGYAADLDELVAFFTEVAGASGLPLLVYNNPAGSKNDLLPGMIARLASIPNVAGVKETSGDGRRFSEIGGLVPAGFEVVVGIDDLALEGFAAGATGWVSGCAVVAPALSVELFELVRRGDLAGARAVYQRLLPLARLDAHPKLVQLFKAGLDLVGQHGGPSRPPRRPLNDAEHASVVAAVRALSAALEVPA